MSAKREEKPWVSQPISPTCEVLKGREFCGLATSYAYPAMGGGWMALCAKHGLKHKDSYGTFTVEELMANGETWEGMPDQP